MRTRLQLHDLLCKILGSNNCYFSPPSMLKYPCILYKLSNDSNQFADNKRYKGYKIYTLTIIDEDPDSRIPGRFEKLQYCSFERFYTADNLNHWVYNLYW